MTTKVKETAARNDKAFNGRAKPIASLDGLLTFEQWAALPDTRPRYELIDGKLVQKHLPLAEELLQTDESDEIQEGFTVEQWAQMPDTKPRYELIDGRLVQHMVATNSHNWAADGICMALREWGRCAGGRFFRESGVKITNRSGYIADVAGYQAAIEISDATYNENPAIVVEVLSPSTASHDRNRKKRNYARIGVGIYLVIDAEKRTLEVFRLHNSTYGKAELMKENDIWQPAELPGLKLQLNDLWM